MDKKTTNPGYDPDKIVQLWNIGSDIPGDSRTKVFPNIQDYKIIKTLGEGGMGIIYLADQIKPIKRQVALKVIKPGMDSRQVLARFEAERQTLALLDHPNIAHIYDAGITDHGLPFFVMEFINGLPITTYCDKEKLSIEERLGLFTHVCNAIHHAHQKGIIHRDIKPSNILVSVQDGKPVPKIIDFGISKAISQHLTEQTVFTEQGQLIGTPEYMSPEQADIGNQDIDTRSDIYSLGILLYELLTGALPFDPKTLRKAAFAEIQRIIREQEPPKPSTRLSSLGKDTKDIVQNRNTKLPLLVKCLHKELEWIPLMAIRKERDHRYRSVSDLAEDVHNYLNGNPLVAGPESVMYQISKFVQRKRALVVGVAAVLVVLIGGIVISTIFAVGQARARKEAQQQADIATAVNEFLNEDLLKSVDPDQARGKKITVRTILDVASDAIESKFKDAPMVEASIQTTIGETYRSLGEYREAEPHFERAREIYQKEVGINHPDTLRSYCNLGSLYAKQGRYKEAEDLVSFALEISNEILGSEHSITQRCRRALATVYYLQNKNTLFQQTIQGLDEAEKHELNILTSVQNNTLNAIERSEALSWAIKDFESNTEKYGEDHPESIMAMINLGAIYLINEDYEKAKPLLIDSLALSIKVLGDEHPSTFDAKNNLSLFYSKTSDVVKAERLMTEIVEGRKRRQGECHPETLKALVNLSICYIESQKYDKAIEIGEYTIEISPDSSRTLANLGIAYMEIGEYNKALSMINRAIELIPHASKCYTIRSGIYYKMGEHDRAFTDCNKAIELNPNNSEAYFNRSGMYINMDDYDSGFADCNKAIELDPSYSETYLNRSKVYVNRGDYNNAIIDLNKAIELDPKNSGAYHFRGEVYKARGEHGNAIIDYNKAIQINPNSYNSILSLGKTYVREGDNVKAIEYFEKAITFEPDVPETHFLLGYSYYTISHAEGALKAFTKVVELKPDFAIAHHMLGLVYVVIGDKESARKEYQILTDLDINSANKLLEVINTHNAEKKHLPLNDLQSTLSIPE